MILARPTLVESPSVRPVSAGPTSAALAADAAGRPDKSAPQTVCGKGRDTMRPSPGSGSLLRSGVRMGALSAQLALLLAAIAFAAPAAAQTSVTLVSNLDEEQSVTGGLGDYDLRGWFTTGSIADGYKLTSVTIWVSLASTSTVTFTVSVIDADGSSLGQLTAPTDVLSNETDTFTASGDGIDLAANTTYGVWVEVTAQGNGEGVIVDILPDGESGAAGWSIGNEGSYRDWDSTGSWSERAQGLGFAVHGYVNGEQSAPEIDLVRIVSAPTYDADDDGKNETYVRGDEILVDVELSEPVSVKGSVQLRLDLGTDDNTLTNSVKTIDLDTTSGVLHGGRTLRFSYEVEQADVDADGLWVQTDGASKVLFTPDDSDNASTIVDSRTAVAAILTKSGLPTAGGGASSFTKVDGSKTASDTGPLPSGATVNGATLEVTYDRALDTSVDTSELPFHFAVQGTGLGGGHRNAYQHPSEVSFATGDNTKLVLTLGEAALAGDRVTLTYKRINHEGPLVDTSDKMAPAFVDLAVTNNTVGTAGPAPLRASVKGTTLRLIFDETLHEHSEPSGDAFLVEAANQSDDRRDIPGTGTAAISGAELRVELTQAVGADDLVQVSYTVPSENPLQGKNTFGLGRSGGAKVLAFERFRVETVYDGIPPTSARGEAMQTSSSPDVSKVIAYFNEPLDTGSVPATGDFAILVAGSAVTVSSVAVEGDAVTLTLNEAIAGGTSVSFGHSPGTNKILDLAGNAAEGFAYAITAVAAAVPMLETSGTDAPAADGASPDADLRCAPQPGQGAGSGEVHASLSAGRRRDRPGGLPGRRHRGRGESQEGRAAAVQPRCYPLRPGADGELRPEDRRAQRPEHRRPECGCDLAPGGGQ